MDIEKELKEREFEKVISGAKKEDSKRIMLIKNHLQRVKRRNMGFQERINKNNLILKQLNEDLLEAMKNDL